MRSRKPLIAAAAAAVLLAGGLAVAKADNLLAWRQSPSAPDIQRVADRATGRDAFTDVLARRAQTLGMRPPLNLATYAPIYPDGLILYASEAPASDRGGQVQYATAAPLRVALDFYEDAAALHHMPFTVTPDGPDTLLFRASDGERTVQARLTRQFATSTVVDLAYD